VDGDPRDARGGDRRALAVKLGRLLRRLRIDEVPQLWNVVGDMAIVGPRPARRFFVDDLEAQIPYYRLRFAVKPVITGWAQVSFRYGATVEDAQTKLEYELYAFQEESPVLYALILLKTLQTVLARPGS
jgi:lipopolysaccharide/colanic/teichoic acid biosynthesis glycosyltransferase